MDRINLGVIGCGVIGPQHMEAAVELEHVNLAAVADIDETRARETAQKFNVPRYYTDPEALLRDPEIDGVILALPAAMRIDLAISALKHGKHIMVEKPAARNVAEYDRIAAAAGDKIIANASARYMLVPHAAPLRDFIATGRLGQVRSIHFRNLVPPGPPPASPPPAWRVSRELNGGGILVNWCTYEIDYIFGLMDWKLTPCHVLAKWWPIPSLFSHYVAPGSDGDEHFSAFISCDANIAVYLERGERVASAPRRSMEIVGSRGSISTWIYPEEEKKIVFTGFENGQADEIIWEGNEGWNLPRRGIVDDFARAIAEKRQPQTDVHRGRILQQIIDAIYLSGDENRPVEIL